MMFLLTASCPKMGSSPIRPDPVLSQNGIDPRSGRIAVVVDEQATESLAPVHPSLLVRRRGRALEQHVVETLVVPLAVVVDEVLTDGL